MVEKETDAPSAPRDQEPQAPKSTPETERVAVKKRRRRGRSFTLFLAAVGLLATALGAATVMFRNQDERLRVVADAIEQATEDPKSFILKEKEELGAWLTEKLPKGEEEARTSPAPASMPTDPTPTSAASAPAANGPGWAAPRETQQKPPVQNAEAEPLRQAPAPSVPPPNAIASDEIAPLVRRLEALEDGVRVATEAAAEARRAAEAKSPSERAEAPAAANLETKNTVAGLEARLDELTQSVAKLQEQLEQPKVGTRATPDVEAGPRPQSDKPLAALESLALAQAVQRALERAKPFAAELAALRRLGADPKSLAELAPFAEKGAPSPRDLLGTFEAVGKKLRAFENKPPEGTPLSDKLVLEAQRLVHLRPKGEAPKATADDITPKIEKALAHDDLAEAMRAFAGLPETTRAEGKEFGDLLAARLAAEEASTALVAAAISALDAGKN
ncbi:COG4223 family protein [Methylocystis bryophila]|uniref:Uncharacterized protein n=1 Tax=Methylocystis bryophila TaxID=655015 RepID=A0A1W6MXQ3_9HYPH|nr:hypothetical protein [Methylocystis bryophila]ARN82378.1 hypothetical protein B1812_16255 [Methylocystis bryophila]BDV38546.1 hypothetical protein DSM21852_17990 [Methylocystis bryophila]